MHRHSFCVDTECECGMRLSTLINTNAALLEALEATRYQDAPCEFGWDCLDKPCLPCMARAAIAQAKGETANG